MKKYSKEWWKEMLYSSFIRAIWTFLEGILGLMSMNQIMSIEEYKWMHIVGVATTMALISFIKSMLAGVPEVEAR